MASIFARSDKFLVGETVSAFPASNWSQAELPPTGAGKGAATATGTVLANGDVWIVGLPSLTDFFLRGGTSGAYVKARSANESSFGWGTLTSAAASAQLMINPLAVVPGAVYRLTLTVEIGGTAETLPQNLRLRNNGAQQMLLPSLPGVYTIEIPRLVPIASAVAFDVTVIATAVVGSIYSLNAVATRVDVDADA